MIFNVPARKNGTLIKEGLELPGAPQMLLALGVSRTAHPTTRRPGADLIGS